MAPVAPIGRDAAIAQVLAGELPFSLGSPHASAMVLEQEGKFRIRELVVSDADVKSAQRSRSPSWMPEHFYALGRPSGKIYAEADSAADLVEIMRTMPWPEAW